MESQEVTQAETNQVKIQSALVKKSKWRGIIIIGILLLLLLLVTGTTIAVLSQLKNNAGKNAKKTFADSQLNNPLLQKIAEKLPIPKITLVPITPAPTETPTSNQALLPIKTQDEPPILTPYLPKDWSKYSDKTFNFSLDYPAGLRTQENSVGLGVADISFMNSDNNKTSYQILIYPKTVGKLIGLDFDILYSLPSSSTERMTSTKTSQIFTKIDNKTINGLRAFEFRLTSDPPDTNVEAEIGAYIEIGESTMIISTAESNKAILDHMLSTFKYSSN